MCTRLRTASDEWPDLSRLNLQPTIGALHLWSQIVGKIRLMTVPWTNHSRHVPLYLSVYGLSTASSSSAIADSPSVSICSPTN